MPVKELISILGYPVLTLAGMFIVLFIKDKTHNIAREEIKQQLIAVLAIFKNELFDALDKTYVRRRECELMMDKRES